MGSFVPEEILGSISGMDNNELDALDFGVVKVDDVGVIQFYNRYESELAGIDPAAAAGKNFFTQLAPCTNNRLFYGRFKSGVAAGSLDITIPYTFTYKMRPTNVNVHIYRDPRQGANWVFVKRR